MFANEADFNAGSLGVAQTGIAAPRRRELHVPTTLYRFGDTPEHALRGGWWMEHSQFRRVQAWAAAHSLALPHAYRVLSAIAHGYSRMHVLVSVTVRVPLLAYEGWGKLQRPSPNGVMNEWVDPMITRSGTPCTQLFVPGLWRADLNAASLMPLSLQFFGVGASHIGGVPGFPDWAIVQ